MLTLLTTAISTLAHALLYLVMSDAALNRIEMLIFGSFVISISFRPRKEVYQNRPAEINAMAAKG